MDVDDRPEGAVGGENYQNADFPGRESGGIHLETQYAFLA